jgi:uncharacterized delta-60 repeat protein
LFASITGALFVTEACGQASLPRLGIGRISCKNVFHSGVHALLFQRMWRLPLVLSLALATGAQPLLLDGTFPAGSGPDDVVRSIEVQNDGRILVGGNFGSFNGVPTGPLVRLLPNGALDPDFRPGPFLNSSDPRLTRVRQLSDGRILAQGTFTNAGGEAWTNIAVLRADGTADRAFALPVTLPRTGSAGNLQPAMDGGFWMTGTFTNAGGLARARLAKLLANGAIDERFQSPFGPMDEVSVSVLPLPDGRIVITGTFTNVGGVAVPRIARLHPNGTLDDSFKSDLPMDRQLTRLALMADGSLVGTVSQRDPWVILETPATLARLRPNGQVDRSFAPAFGYPGSLITAFNRVLVLLPEPDGSLLVAGSFLAVEGQPRHGLARILEDGSVAACFDPGIGTSGYSISIARQEDGRVLIGGIFRGVEGQHRPYLAGLENRSECGPGDFAFATPEFVANEGSPSALVTVLRDGSTARAESVRVETSDGTARAGEDYEPVARTLDFARGERARTISIPLRSDATIEGDETVQLRLGAATSGRIVEGTSRLRIVDETEFQTSGGVDLSFRPPIDAPVTAADVTGLGEILLAVALTNATGYPAHDRSSLRKFHADGSLDESFRTNLLDSEVFAIAALSTDGFVVAGAFQRVNGVARPGLARFDRAGNFDESFDPFAGHTSTATYENPVVTAMEELADGSIVCAGELPESPRAVHGARVFKILPDGTLDPEFFAAQERQANAATALARMHDGSFIAGLPGEAVVLGRFFLSGMRDSRFIPPAHYPPNAESIAVMPDGTIVAGGSWAWFAPNGPTLARVARNGGAVETFSSNAGISIDLNESLITRVLAAKDGRLLAAGRFRVGLEPARVNVTRFNADGTRDPSFHAGSGATPRPARFQDGSNEIEASIRVLKPLPNGGWLVGGDFAGFNGVPQPFLTRLASFSEAAASVRLVVDRWEVAESAGQLWVDVARGGTARNEMTARLATTAITAAPGVHFEPLDKALTFAPGEWLKRVPIRIYANDRAESNRTFRIALRLPENETSGIVTIVDDDVNIEFIAETFTVNEGDPMARIGVRRVGLAGREITAELTMDEPSLASFPIQFVATTQGSETNFILVPIRDDDFFSGDQSRTLRLAVLAGQATLGVRSRGSLRIVENDFPRSPRRGVAGIVNVITPGPHGGVYLAGDFTAVHGIQSARIARLSPNGLVDTTFDAGGGPDGPVKALAVLNDGRLLIAGDFATVDRQPRRHVARLFVDGSVDPNFNPGSGAMGTTDYPAKVLALLPGQDDSVLVGGRFTSFQGRVAHGIVRLHANGTLDPDFKPDLTSLYTSPYPWNLRFPGYGIEDSPSTVTELHRRPDGGLAVVGDLYAVERRKLGTYPSATILGLEEDGSLDTNFFRQGTSDPIGTVAPLADGGWLAGTTYSRHSRTAKYWVAIRRLKHNGAIDQSFLPRGTPDLGITAAAVRQIMIDPRQRIVFVAEVSGTVGARFGHTVVARLLPDGAWDDSFEWIAATNSSSLVLPPRNPLNAESDWRGSGSIRALAWQSDETLFLGGVFNEINGEPRRRLARFDSDGRQRGQLALSISDEAAGLLRIATDAEAEVPYVIERSRDLDSWEKVRTNATPWSPLLIQLEAEAAGPHEYYRAVTVPRD